MVIAYLEFWSQLYQYITSARIDPLEMLSDGSNMPVTVRKCMENMMSPQSLRYH